MEYGTGRGVEPGATGGYGEGAPASTTAATQVQRSPHSRPRRLATETKQAFKTTEFWIYLVILLGLFIAGIFADADEGSEVDGFGANQVWLYAVILTLGYLLSRGLAKSGSRDPYWDSDSETGGDDPPLTERVKAAAQELKGGDR